jgi:hypothetical protein
MNVLKTEDLEQDGWRMVFRGTSGNGHSVYHAWIDGTLNLKNIFYNKYYFRQPVFAIFIFKLLFQCSQRLLSRFFLFSQQLVSNVAWKL